MEGQRTGLGHQYRNEEKAILHCKGHLSDAFNSICGFGNIEIEALKLEILKLENKCHQLAYSAREAQKQDN